MLKAVQMNDENEDVEEASTASPPVAIAVAPKAAAAPPRQLHLLQELALRLHHAGHSQGKTSSN